MKLSRFLHLEAPRSGDAPPSVPPDRSRIEAVLGPKEGAGTAHGGQASSKENVSRRPENTEPEAPPERGDVVDRALIDLPFERTATPPREGKVQLIDDAPDIGPRMDLQNEDFRRESEERARESAAKGRARLEAMRKSAEPAVGPVRPPPELVPPLDENAPYLLWIWQYASTTPVRVSLIVVLTSSLAILFLAGGPLGQGIGAALLVVLFLGVLPRRWARRLWPWIR